MPVMTGLSGNEMYCLHQKGLQAGDMVIGNSVFSVGFIGGIGSGLRTLAGGEVTQITSVIHDGRQQGAAADVVARLPDAPSGSNGPRGTPKTDPIEARSAFGPKGSAQPGERAR